MILHNKCTVIIMIVKDRNNQLCCVCCVNHPRKIIWNGKNISGGAQTQNSPL